MDAFQKLGAKCYGIWSRNMRLGRKREIGKDNTRLYRISGDHP